MSITSRSLRDFEAHLNGLEIDINGDWPYFNGEKVSTGRLGWTPLNALTFFEQAASARRQAEDLIAAADAMDRRIGEAMGRS
jgi:hypothetical protein